MKKLIIGLLLVLVISIPAGAAYVYDGSDYVGVDDGAAWTFPDADWTMCMRIQFSSRTGTTRRDLWHWEAGTPFIRVRVGDASASDADDFNVTVIDDDGTNISFSSTSNPFASNTSWGDVCLRRSGTTINVYLNGTSHGSGSNASIDGINAATSMILGNNGPALGNSATFLGNMTDICKWDRALTTDDLNARSKGYACNCFPQSLKINIPMIRNAVELVNSLPITTSGTGVSNQPALHYCR